MEPTMLTRRACFRTASHLLVPAAVWSSPLKLWGNPSDQPHGSTPATPAEVIDCHTHFYDPTRPAGVPWPPRESPLYRTVLPADLRKQPTHFPLTGTVVVEASPWVADNDWLLALAADDPLLVGIVGNLEPGQPAFAPQLDRLAQNPLFRGIRLRGPIVQQILEQDHLSDLARLQKHDLALDLNGGPETPALAARVAQALPDLRIVINHLGNVRIGKAAPPVAWVQGIAAAGQARNVSLKISALVEGAARAMQPTPTELDHYRPYLDVVWNAFGPDRVIYGSNWPVSERAADYQTLQKLACDYVFEQGGQTALEKFCAGNAQQIYRWVNRPGRPRNT
jgi:L-fuconolactonase